MTKIDDELLDIYDMEESRFISELEGLPMDEATFTAIVAHYKSFGGRKFIYKRMMEMKSAGISKAEAIRTMGHEVHEHLRSRGVYGGTSNVIPFKAKR